MPLHESRDSRRYACDLQSEELERDKLLPKLQHLSIGYGLPKARGLVWLSLSGASANLKTLHFRSDWCPEEFEESGMPMSRLPSDMMASQIIRSPQSESLRLTRVPYVGKGQNSDWST